MAKESILSRLRNKPEDSENEEGSLRKELMELRIQHTQGQLKETHKIREVRKQRIKTAMNQKAGE